MDWKKRNFEGANSPVAVIKTNDSANTIKTNDTAAATKTTTPP